MTGRRWAYIGVFLGFAASITANVASTVLKTTDVSLWLRVPFAVFWPLATYVAIEVLVRTDWQSTWSHKGVRLVLAGPVGLVAAFVSYLHQHHLMVLAGEPGLAQGFGPLAVDGMLFGMTATLIVTRTKMATGHDEMASGHDEPTGAYFDPAVPNLATAGHYTSPDMATSGQWPEDIVATSGHVATRDVDASLNGQLATHPWMPAEDWAKELDELAKQDEMAIAQAGRELATEAERVANGQAAVDIPVVPGQLPQRVAKEPVPPGAVMLIRDLLHGKATKAEVDQAVMDQYGKSLRTARRWRSIVTGQPVSGPPSDQES